MPYKDINQQREKSRLAMRILRAQRKGLTTDRLTKKKRVNLVNKKRLTSKNNPSLNSPIFANFMNEILTEIRNLQQNFFTQIENLVCTELDKFTQKNSQQQSAPKSKTRTTTPTKSASSPGKVKVDAVALVQATGLQVDWRKNSPWRKIWKAEYNRLYKKRLLWLRSNKNNEKL